MSIFKSTFFKNTSFILLGTASSQVILTLSSLVIVRVFSPEEFGKFAIATSIISILGNTINLKFDQAQVIAKPEHRSLLFKIGTFTSFFFVILIILGVNIFGNHLVTTKFGNILKNELYLISVWTILFSLIFILRYLHISYNSFKTLAIALPLRATLIVVSQISCGLYYSPSVRSLLYGQIIGEISNFLILFIFAIKNKFIHNASFQNSKKIFLEYKEFPLITTPNYFLHTLTNNLDSILLLSFYNSKIVGFYALALKVLNAPINLISNSLRDAFFKKISDYQDDYQRVRKNFLKLFFTIAGVGSIPFAILFFWGNKIFAFIFGEPWALAGDIASALSIYLFLIFSLTPVFSILKVIKKQHLQLFYQVLQLSSRVLIIVFLSKKLEITHLISILSAVSSTLLIGLSVLCYQKLGHK